MKFLQPGYFPYSLLMTAPGTRRIRVSDSATAFAGNTVPFSIPAALSTQLDPGRMAYNVTSRQLSAALYTGREPARTRGRYPQSSPSRQMICPSGSSRVIADSHISLLQSDSRLPKPVMISLDSTGHGRNRRQDQLNLLTRRNCRNLWFLPCSRGIFGGNHDTAKDSP